MNHSTAWCLFGTIAPLLCLKLFKATTLKANVRLKFIWQLGSFSPTFEDIMGVEGEIELP